MNTSDDASDHDSMSANQVLSTGSHDDDDSSVTSQNPQPLQLADYPVMLAKWLGRKNRYHYVDSKLQIWQHPDNTADPTEHAAATDEHRLLSIEIAQIAAQMDTWMTTFDTKGDYGAHTTQSWSALEPLLVERMRLMEVMARAHPGRMNNATSQSGPGALAIAQDELTTHNGVVSAAIDACHHQATELMPSTASTTAPNPAPAGPLAASPPAPLVFPALAPRPLAPTGPAPAATDSLFVGVKLASAYTYLGEYPGLQWPTTDDRAKLLARTPVQALRPGMVVLALTCTGTESFRNLLAPDAYYVVTAEYPDNSTRLALAYANPASKVAFPPGATFEARPAPYSVIALSDATVRGNLLDKFIMDHLKAISVPLIAPDTPAAQRPGVSGTGTTKDAHARAEKALQPLRRALNNDKGKLQRLIQNATDQKLTDPAIIVNIRNLQASSAALLGIPALNTDNIPHLLAFHWCIDLELTGTSKKPDAMNFLLFKKNRPGEITEYADIDEIRGGLVNMKTALMTITMERDHGFFNPLFNRLIDQLMDTHEDRKIVHFHPDFLVRHLNTMFTEDWAPLFRDEPYATKSTEEFYKLNEQALTIDVQRWRNKFLHMDAKDLPPQRPKRPAPPRPARKGGRDRPDGPTPQGKRRRRGSNPTTPPATAPVQAPPAAPALAAAPPPKKPTPAICARRIFHQADPTIFKEDCTRNPCQFRHNVRLHNGKLGAGDKETLRASLEAMNGKFADLALQHIDALL